MLFDTPEAVGELARRMADVDVLADGVTALWEAVVGRRPDAARVLVEAGADPWRPLLGGWSPGRLSLAGPTPGLFAVPAGESLTPAERTRAEEARRLTAALGGLHDEGLGLACVAEVDAAEAIRRLGATPAADELVDAVLDDPFGPAPAAVDRLVGVTSVPGGCVVTQPWGFAPQTTGVLTRLSAGTVCYGLYANPKSGDQGAIARDGTVEASDLHPGGGPQEGDTSAEVLDAYLYRLDAVAYACAFAGLRPTDGRGVTGPPDAWVELPRSDHRRG
ncbi:ankyrin repeat domain-containing protein [Streptomyces sp. NPDC050400]|uniref:ankyrin repeat domain-containing protein n=1 Tax=Streptomyces sp. NPDC050400 TaxID=3365610 RepID=UPI0037AEA8E3